MTLFTATCVDTLLLHFRTAPKTEQNMQVAIDTSEFSYLPAQAQAMGVPVPSVRRVTLPLSLIHI